jgi:hypothetical protein
MSALFLGTEVRLPFCIMVSNEKLTELINSATIQRSSFQSLRDDASETRFPAWVIESSAIQSAKARFFKSFHVRMLNATRCLLVNVAFSIQSNFQGE